MKKLLLALCCVVFLNGCECIYESLWGPHSRVDHAGSIQVGDKTLQVGMNKEQVLLVVGKPKTIQKRREGIEIWVYSNRINTFTWFYNWAKLKFKDDKLIDL